jgi:hypothetical protein
MARKLSVTKSNYYIVGGQFASYKMIMEDKVFSDDKSVEKFAAFVFSKIFTILSKSEDLKKHRWFSLFKSNPNVNKLFEIFNTQKTQKNNRGEVLLTKISSQIFWNAIHEIKNGKMVEEVFKNKWFNVLYEFYEKEMPNYLEKYEEVLNPEWLKISNGFKEEVSLLLKGYDYYLINHENGMSERKLCEYIEDKVIKRILNVRQDYQVYERFFDEMGSAIGAPIDNKFKLAYLKSCYDPYLTV